MRKLLLGAVALSMVAVGPAFAVDNGKASPTDPRVRYYDYSAEEVFGLTGYYGYVTSVFFREDEKIDTVSAGDSKGWQVEISKSRDFVFLKPIGKPAVDTNLTVVTNHRIYTFALRSREAQNGDIPNDLAFKVRFNYPEPPIPDTVPAALNYVPDTGDADRAAALAEAERARLEAERQRNLDRLAAPSVIFDETEKEEEDENAIDPTRDFNDEYRQRIEGSRTDDQIFLEDQASVGVAQVKAVRIANLDKKVIQGSLIPGVLETAINTDLSGMVRATVAENVWSHDGTRILVPRGARLIGAYKNTVRFGTARVFITWNRMVTGDGVSVQLGSPGVDTLGRAGLEGHADTHFIERFGSAALVSIIAGGTVLAVGSLDDDVSEETGGELATALTENIGAAANPYLNIPTTINVDQGARIIVFTNRDLDFTRAYPDDA